MKIKTNFASKIKNKPATHFLATASRILLGVIFLTAGLSKLLEFPVLIGPVGLEQKAAEYGLALFARFVAVSEALVGAMLLSRFKTLAAIMLFPMLLAILMFTISLQWQGTPIINSLLLLLNVGILFYDWPKLKFIFTDQVEHLDDHSLSRKLPGVDAAWLAGMVLFIIGMCLLETSSTFRYLLYSGLAIMLAVPFTAKWLVP